MFRSTLGARRLSTAFVLSAALVGCVLAGAQGALADEINGLEGGPAPVDGPIVGFSHKAAAEAAAPAALATPAPGAARTNQQAKPQEAQVPAGPARRARLVRWEVNPTLQYTISSGSDIAPSNPALLGNRNWPLDLYRITGDAVYRFNRHAGLQYQHIAHTGAGGRGISSSGAVSYGGASWDYEDRALGTWAFDQYLTYRAGYHYRAKVCCPNAGDKTNPTPRTLGGFFNDLTWRYGPNTIGGKPWSTNFRWEQNHHTFNAAAQAALARGQSDSGQKPTFSFTTYSNFYVWHQTKLVPYYGIEYFSTYFNNTPTMSITYRKVPGVLYRATPDLSYRFYIKNDQPGGSQAHAGSGTHKSTSFLEATYRFHSH